MMETIFSFKDANTNTTTILNVDGDDFILHIITGSNSQLIKLPRESALKLANVIIQSNVKHICGDPVEESKIQKLMQERDKSKDKFIRTY